MANATFFVFSIILFVIGIPLFAIGFIWLKQKRLIENIPTSKIRSIAMGLVEIYGEIVPWQDTTLKSPMTNRDCVYYKYSIEEYHRSGKHSHWVTIKKDMGSIHFNLKDETGMVLVNPKGAKIDIPRDFEFKSGFGKDPPKSVQRFLKINNLRFEGSLFGFNKTMRFRESFIEPFDKLYIMGTADDNPFVDDATTKKGVEDVLIQKGKHDKFYYISDKSEREVLKALKGKVVFGIGLGSICIIIGLMGIL